MSLNNALSFYSATVPVCRHYMTRSFALLEKTQDDHLTTRLAPDMMDCGTNIRVAQGFAFRTICPVLNRTTPELPWDDTSQNRLRGNHACVIRFLDDLVPEDFTNAPDTSVTHIAGEAKLTQTASDYVTLFALPNMLFHISMAYAALRYAGVDVGKSDFDGLHIYTTAARDT